ncbi:hypothetical protein BSU04_40640 [Caballeronia sordidicola]|uniref:Uncharacterized protein n=1 Tax=Caballeronia sordidicola TaxID=196367 RepID=A0A226WPP6_CABSO|nr:hypothetical protein BSU04_40640 [Caballeronia sordidicola]
MIFQPVDLVGDQAPSRALASVPAVQAARTVVVLGRSLLREEMWAYALVDTS